MLTTIRDNTCWTTGNNLYNLSSEKYRVLFEPDVLTYCSIWGNTYVGLKYHVFYMFLPRFCMVESSNGIIFRVTDPLCGECTGHRWIPLTKASDAELLMFSLISAWTNSWGNNRDAGDFRRRCTHYDVTVMNWILIDLRAKLLLWVPFWRRFIKYAKKILGIISFAKCW